MDIVIARYNEPIEWIQEIPTEHRVHLYNKGPPLDGPSIQLENIGRESHTYLTHIVRNYERLSKYTVFIQANPFDHVAYAKWSIPGWLKKWKQQLDEWGYTRGEDITTEHDFHWPHGGVTLQDLTLAQWAYRYIDDNELIEYPHVCMYDGACFGIRRDYILKRPKEYYQRLLDLHTTVNPEESYFMERMWMYVFKVRLPTFTPANLTLENMKALVVKMFRDAENVERLG
jgi:hypothetical protein